MKKEQNKETMDKNFFKAMNYELGGEIGILDNEEMKNNVGLSSEKNRKRPKENKK